MAIRSDRLIILRSLWTLGAVVLCRIALFAALIGAGIFVLIGVAALLEGFDPLPWFRFSVLIWAPLAAGFAVGDVVRRFRTSWSREGRPSDVEMVAGWRVGGLAMSDRPSWINSGAAILVMGGVLAVDLAPPELGIEFVRWVTTGDWPGIAVADGLSLPYSIWLLVGGLLLCVEGLNLGDWSSSGAARWFTIR
jgi:hypothetical protein